MPVACCVLTLCQCTWIVQPQPRAGSSYRTLAINSRVQLGEATVLAQAGVFDVQLPDAAVPECADAEESEDDAVDRGDDEGMRTGEVGEDGKSRGVESLGAFHHRPARRGWGHALACAII